MYTKILPAEDPDAIQRAASLIREGGLVAFPTDTVYGLGVLVDNILAIEQLYLVKERHTMKAIAVLIGKISHLQLVTDKMNYLALRLGEEFWPGPLTLVVPRHASLPENLSPSNTIGVRMPDHTVALELLKQTGPLAVTSANISGEPSSQTAQEVLSQLGRRIPLILDGGRTPGGKPSTVVDCTSSEPVILRDGPISIDNLKGKLG